MAVYWEEHRCKVCGEPLNTNDERDMGVHEECDPIDRVSGARIGESRCLARDIVIPQGMSPAESHRFFQVLNNPGYAGLRGC